MQPQDQYEMVVDSLQIVAADAEDQMVAVPDFASPTDEVATTFGDAYLLVPQLVRAGLLSKEARDAMLLLDGWFAQMPADGSVADPSTLYGHAYWAEARRLARAALAALGVAQRSPRQTHVAWVEGFYGE